MHPGAGDYLTESIAIELKAKSPRAVIGNESRFDGLVSHVAYKKTQPLQHRQDAAKF